MTHKILFRICFYVWATFLLINWAHTQAYAAQNNYAVHIASYKTKGQAEDDIRKLKNSGYGAFWVETEIKGKGHWYRVYSGRHETRKKAVKSGEEIKNKKLADSYYVYYLPAGNPKKVPTSNKETKKVLTIKNPGTAKDEKDVRKGNLDELKKKLQEAREFTKAKAPPQLQTKEKLPQPKAAEKSLQPKAMQQVANPLALLDEKEEKRKTESLPVEEDIAEPASGSELYDKALGEMKKKNYQQALIIFKELVERQDTSNSIGEKALRHMANCHYYLGEKGDKEHLLIAVEFYKNTIKNFPDPRKGNALTYFRLGKTYGSLKYYPEALKAYDGLISQYPDSPYNAAAMYSIGEILYKSSKYNAAADKLIAYLMKYRGGEYARQTFYMIADSYYKSSQASNAEVWFRDAQKKWPELLDVPKDIVLNMGHHKYSLRRFDEAISIFSAYVNYYPNDEKVKETLLMLAKTYEEAQQGSAALATYSKIIEKYPESKEATESMMAIAALGINKPGIKVFVSQNYLQYYKRPLEAYDTIVMKNPNNEIAEDAMLKKAEALGKFRNYRKSVDTYMEFINLYPQSRKIDEARTGLKNVSATIIDDFYAKKDYLAVADIYFKAYSTLPRKSEEGERIIKVADSLKEVGLIDDSVKLLQDYRGVCQDPQLVNRISLGIVLAQLAKGKLDLAEKEINELIERPSLKNLALIPMVKKAMAEIAYKKGSYDQAVTHYNSFINTAAEMKNPGETYLLYASALQRKNENTLALQNYLNAARYLSQNKQTAPAADEVYLKMGDLFFKTNNFKDSINTYKTAYEKTTNPEYKSWFLFQMGRSYYMMGNNAEEQKLFAQIKTESGPEGFWTKVVDYYEEDQKWRDKYERYLK